MFTERELKYIAMWFSYIRFAIGLFLVLIMLAVIEVAYLLGKLEK